MSLKLINFDIHSDNLFSILYGITFDIYVVITLKDNVLKSISKIRKLKHRNAKLFSKQEKLNSAIVQFKIIGKQFVKNIYNF